MGIIAMLGALFTAITELMKNVNMWFPDIMKLIHGCIAEIEVRAQRIIDAAKTSVEAELKAASEQTKKEQANLAAFKLIVDESWKTRYEQVLSCINAGQEEGVLVILEAVDNAVVDDILFHSKYSNEIKALKIVEIQRNK